MTRVTFTPNNIPIITLPKNFTFKSKGFIDFNQVLEIFPWDIKTNHIIIDARSCLVVEYQALTLLIQYIWYLKQKNIHINLQYHHNTPFGLMWRRIDGKSCYKVLSNKQSNFNYVYNKPLFAIRSPDHNITRMLDIIRDYAQGLPMDLIKGYEDTIRYIISELTYNTLEHGFNPQIPSLLQFNWSRVIKHL